MSIPSIYQRVEYIQTDGNQYIDTGVIPSDYTDGIYYELDFCAEPTGSGDIDYLFGCLSGESRSGNFGANFDQGNIRLIAGSTSSTATYNWYNIRNRCIARVFATSENPASRSLTFERDGTVTTPTPLISNYESKPMPSESIYLFNCRGISRISCAVTCWGFNMTAADGTPIRNFVPCYRISDNAAGLYDTVTSAFYENAGTGTFVVGADVHAKTYAIESNTLQGIADAIRAKTGSSAKIIVANFASEIGSITGGESITYPLADKPETMGQRACLARAAQMRDIQWTLKGDLTMTGGDVYPSGKVVTGLPYSSVRKTDRFIGYNISLYTFMTAVHNPRSLLYTTTAAENTADNGNIANLYYGVNCSVFGSFAHDWNYHSATNTIPELSYIEEIDPSEMKLCDLPVASLDHGGGVGHCTMVTTIERNADGSIANLEISETTLPITRATKMTYAAFLSTYINGAGYKVYRDNRLYDTSYKPSPFVRVFDEESVEDIVYSNLCTNRGDKVSITTDEDIKLNVLIDSGYEAIVLMKDGVLYGTYLATNGDIMDGDLPLSGLPVGLYTAALFDSDGVALDNAYTSFEVCSVSARQNGNRYYFQGDGIPVRVVFKDSGGYTIAVFDVTDEDIARGYKDIPYATSKTITQICVPFKTRYGFVVARCAYDPAGTSGGEGEVDPPDTPSENLPTEYQQVEYVATDGNQYIDTGVIPSDHTDGIYYELDFAAAGAGSNNTDYLFGCLSGEGRSGNFGANFDQGNIRLIAGSTSSTATYNWYNIRNRCIARVFATSENPASRSLTFERDGTVTTPTPLISNYESKPMPSESIYLFNCRGISRISCAVTCWGFNMTAADGTPIRNFVPCYRKSDNVIGLYDMVEGKFYTNAGTGAFTKGADV